MIAIHASAKVSPLADIEDSVRGTRIDISEGVVIDAFVKIKPVGGVGDVFIGPDSVINSGCVLYSGNGIRMGRGVLVAANCTFAPVNHEYARRDVPIAKQGFRAGKGGIVIGDDVWIGANCVILDGAQIGDGCVVAAGSIVRGALEAYGVYGGNPLARLGERK
ncbi:MAG TPA: acyltransferase [Arenimonas sp.]|uniref:acyltransferase n=1 Tax=Arenimonas sp. TaxID=1872635 RepID=UPI002BEC1C1B|nr:acyltransferase [Arenimonas sp.]HMB56357.1 acyltransferase [Arenimonas sp.]